MSGFGPVTVSGNVGDALTTNPLSQFAATTSAQLFGVLSNETGGTGVVVGSASPAFTGSVTGDRVALTSTSGTALTAVGQSTGQGAVFTGGSGGATGVTGNGGGSGGNANGVIGSAGSGGSGVQGFGVSGGLGILAQNNQGGFALQITGDSTAPIFATLRHQTVNAQPTGAHVPGDSYVSTEGIVFTCTTAGTPGTWTAIGDQTRAVPATLTTAGTGIALDFALGPNKIFDVQGSSGNVTLTLSNPVSGQVYRIKGIQGSSARTLTWSPAVKWPAGVAPTFTITDNAEDIFELWYDGTSYNGTFAQAFA